MADSILKRLRIEKVSGPQSDADNYNEGLKDFKDELKIVLIERWDKEKKWCDEHCPNCSVPDVICNGCDKTVFFDTIKEIYKELIGEELNP